MYRCAVNEVAVGAALGASVFNETGSPLVKAGVRLGERQLHEIQRRGYVRLVLLDDGEAPRPEFVLPEVRAMILRALSRTVAYLLDHWRNDALHDDMAAFALDTLLRKAVRDFITEAGDVDGLTLPGPVRRGSAQWLDDAINAAAVAVYLGKQLGMDPAALHRLGYGMLLRDVDLLMLPPGLLDKTGQLSPEDWERVRLHPRRAYEVLCALGWGDEGARLVVLQHHERHDGSGYPDGIRGLHTIERSRREHLDLGISLLVSDIAAVADVFNALTVDRPHRPARPVAEVEALLRGMGGAQLNGAVVDLLLSVWRPPTEARASTAAA